LATLYYLLGVAGILLMLAGDYSGTYTEEKQFLVLVASLLLFALGKLTQIQDKVGAR